MKRGGGSGMGFFTIGVAALFLAGFFLLVVFGAQSYRNTVAEQNGNMATRTLLSYLSMCIKDNDTAGSVSVRDTEYGPALIVADGDTGYALRIYRYDGALVEDFAASDAALKPDSAEVIGATDLFAVTEMENGLLAVDTDAGRVLIRPRSAEGGAAG